MLLRCLPFVLYLYKTGLTEEHALTELDLTYKSRFAGNGQPRIPDAYERLILDVIKGLLILYPYLDTSNKDNNTLFAID